MADDCQNNILTIPEWPNSCPLLFELFINNINTYLTIFGFLMYKDNLDVFVCIHFLLSL